MSDKPKFCHLAYHIHENLFRAPIMIGGFYNWHLAMEGEFHLYPAKRGQLEQYDILFVGLSRPELDGVLLSQIRKEIGPNSKTKIVACIDYAVELWQGDFNPYMLENELMCCDMIFVAEPAMQSHVISIINGRKPIHLISHPTNVEAIKHMMKPFEIRTDTIAVMIHRYDNNWLDPFLAVKDLPWDACAVLLDPGIMVHLHAYYKFIREGQDFIPHLDWVSRQKVVLDSYHRLHTYGRTPVDNACLQVPTIGGDWTYAQSILWPDLTVKCGDTWGQSQIIRKLMTDKSFYIDCAEKASEKVEDFNYENVAKELMDKLYN